MADGRRTALATVRDRAVARTQVINVDLVPPVQSPATPWPGSAGPARPGATLAGPGGHRLLPCGLMSAEPVEPPLVGPERAMAWTRCLPAHAAAGSWNARCAGSTTT